MLIFFLYLLVLAFGVFVPLLISLFALINLAGDLFGAPFVPTSGKIVDQILAESKLKKGQTFYELGSGDGRIVRRAVLRYGVSGVGIDIHPMLILYSKAISRLQGLQNIHFITGNFYNIKLSEANVLFLFLVPKTLQKMRFKLLKECQKRTLIISHGFKIEDWEKYLIKTIDRKIFPTYYYQL